MNIQGHLVNAVPLFCGIFVNADVFCLPKAMAGIIAIQTLFVTRTANRKC